MRRARGRGGGGGQQPRSPAHACAHAPRWRTPAPIAGAVVLRRARRVRSSRPSSKARSSRKRHRRRGQLRGRRRSRPTGRARARRPPSPLYPDTTMVGDIYIIGDSAYITIPDPFESPPAARSAFLYYNGPALRSASRSSTTAPACYPLDDGPSGCPDRRWYDGSIERYPTMQIETCPRLDVEPVATASPVVADRGERRQRRRWRRSGLIVDGRGHRRRGGDRAGRAGRSPKMPAIVLLSCWACCRSRPGSPPAGPMCAMTRPLEELAQRYVGRHGRADGDLRSPSPTTSTHARLDDGPAGLGRASIRLPTAPGC